eukprot:CAMPEP_0174377814 /NCGR_PEP_ID=MMETSP0811_2-20130205/121674_1 /TAXON_ID=73025 ORGANISM="Eutreptiella gymnastica-like, Strain CCMP1594" /NCGR_SAMPLE_ID=MMETSP0811_2 /ASSEMBLY_ACC=CAM_ASM_000667 /LENGTH=80 /DNA_ID=CAMNT_0015529899 /DNA_START=752 /DNA_END=994 /DNA_ORIENTATION=-
MATPGPIMVAGLSGGVSHKTADLVCEERNSAQAQLHRMAAAQRQAEAVRLPRDAENKMCFRQQCPHQSFDNTICPVGPVA